MQILTGKRFEGMFNIDCFLDLILKMYIGHDGQSVERDELQNMIRRC